MNLQNPRDLFTRLTLAGEVSGEVGAILRRLCATHPRAATRDELMQGARLYPNSGKLRAYTSFYWHVERANDLIRRYGFEIIESGPLQFRIRRHGR